MNLQGSRLSTIRFSCIALSTKVFFLAAIALGCLASPREAKAVINLTRYCGQSAVLNSDGSWNVNGYACSWGWMDGGPSYGGNAGDDYGHGGGRNHKTFISVNIQPSGEDDKSGCEDAVGKPILVGSGTKVENYPIFSLPGEMGLSFTLYYNNALKIPQALSNPYWSTNLQFTLTAGPCHPSKQNPDELICGGMIYLRPDGSEIRFTGAPQGSSYTGPGLATLSYNSASGKYTLHDEDATTKVFDSNGFLLSITNSSGISWTISQSSSSNGTTFTVTHSSGRSYSVTYGVTANGVTPMTVADPAGNIYSFTMTGAILAPDFQSITYPGTPATTVSFKYSSVFPGYLTEVDYNGKPYDYTSYNTTPTDPHYGWATANYLADNSESVAINYGQSAAGNLQATITNALGHRYVQTYDGTNGAGGAYNGQLSQVTHDTVATCGATIQNREYDANGNLSLTVDNNNNVTAYTYASTGQLQSEVEAYGTPLARTTSYVWDSNLQLNRLTSVTVEGWSKTAYTYTTQNRLASVKVTNLSSTGVANQTLTTTYVYTLYSNGMVHTMTVTRPSPGNSDTDTYTYDSLGNLASLTNGLGQTTTYSDYNGLGEVRHVVGPNGDVTDYTYDGRGRVLTKTSYPNGSAATWTYGYDGFGLPASEIAPDGRTTTWNRDLEMRVKNIVRNDKDGTSTESFGYNENSDVTSHTVTRAGVTSLSQTIRYDALGRVYQRQGMHNQLLTYGYDGNGNVLSVTDAAGHIVTNQYDALNRLTRTTSSGGASPPMPSTAPTLSVPSSSISGSYSVSWGAVGGATTYILQKEINGGSWGTAQSANSTSFTLSGQASGTYRYRVQGCNVTGCGPWSSVVTVYVTHVIGTIDGVLVDGTNATVTGWACSTGLTQSVGVEVFANGASGGGGTRVTTGVANQPSEAAVATQCQASGSAYRFAIPLSASVRSQYAGTPLYLYGDSPVGNGNPALTHSGINLVPAPSVTGAPTLTVPATNTTGNFTVSWSGIADATSYSLQERVNGGAWSTIQTGSPTSRAISGKSNGTYGYQVQACNSTDCGPWSSVASSTVLLPPSAPASLSVPTTSSGNVAVSWSASSTATSYTLQHRLGAGTWGTVYSGGAVSKTVAESVTGSYTYQVQACNASDCSGWKASSAVAVTIPPASAPAISTPASNSSGSYTVSWGSVSGATSYTLQEQVNGGAWATIQASAARSRAISGKSNGTYGYHVQACNVGGCGPWSAVSNVAVLLIPPTPTGISATIYKIADSANGESMMALSTTTTEPDFQTTDGAMSPQARPIIYEYDLSASWSAAAGASRYDVQYCSSSSCSTYSTTSTNVYIVVNAATSTMNVRACNSAGCSAWSATVTPTKVNG